MPGGPVYRVFTGGYHPSYAGEQLIWKVTVTNAATLLGDLLITAGATTPGIPQIKDEIFATAPQTNPVPKTRPPWHVMFQVPAGAANPVYASWDLGSAAPVVGGPGMEFEPGTVYKFEQAGESLLRVNSGGIYPVTNKSSFKFIATANTSMLVIFSD